MTRVLIYGRREGKSARMRIAIDALRAAGHTVIEAEPTPGLTGLRADIVAIDCASTEETVLHMMLSDGTHVWQGPQPGKLAVFEYSAIHRQPPPVIETRGPHGHGRACMCDRCAGGKRPKNSY